MSVSLVLGSREVSVGPTAALQSEVAAVVVGGGGAAATGPGGAEKQRVVVSSLLGAVQKKSMCFASKSSSSVLDGFVRKSFAEESDEEISSEEEELSDTEDEEKVQIKLKGPLSSMGSLEESLPIKRGLSNFFSGKSKSFANFSEVTSVSDLAKPDNPFNKRRRTLIARSLAIRPIKSSLCFASVPSVLNDHDIDHL